MGVIAKMRKVLTFPRDGGPATIENVYTPYKVDAVIDTEHFSEAEIKAMLSRTDFPTSRETVFNLTFHNELKSESTFGSFGGDNPNIGENAPLSGKGAKYIQGHVRMDYEKTAGMICQIFYVDFTDSIVQTYRIIDPPYPTWGR